MYLITQQLVNGMLMVFLLQQLIEVLVQLSTM